MRIGIDMLAVQSPGSRRRGIGRYGDQLLRTLIERDAANHYVLYVHDGFPSDLPYTSPNATIRALSQETSRGEATLHDALDRLVRANPDDLDTFLVLSPFELCPGYGPPAKPLNGLRMTAVVYDLIPFLFPDLYLADPPNAARFYRRLRNLRGYDTLLTISEATQRDCLRLMGVPPGRVMTIGGASDGRFFVPDRSEPMPPASRLALERLGIDRPFLFHLGGMDDRKNLWGLIDAYRMLPTTLRESHQLVVTCIMDEDYTRRSICYAEERGVSDAFVLTGPVPDETLRVLYQRCAAFAFPSRYEGLGLPLLEAMHCGSAVVAGGNSAQSEVVGDAGLLANAHDPADIAVKLARVLEDHELARTLGERARERAARFTWEQTADRALEALTGPADRSRPVRLRADRGHAPRPRVAMFSPYPPKGSGISDYAVRLLGGLKRHYTIDLYHDSGYVPDLGVGSSDHACYDYRLFERNASILDYRGIVYHMGNSFYHKIIYEMLLRHPGVVSLHDFSLSAFQYWYSHLHGVEPGHFLRELEHYCPGRFQEYLPQLEDWHREDGGMQVATTRRGLYLNRRVFEHSRAVIVHSAWCREQVRAWFPEHLDRTVVIPHGAAIATTSPERRFSIRARFDLPDDALVLGCFGILCKGKMNVEALDAFAVIAPDVPSALMVFVGEDWEKGQARAKAAELGLLDRVRFLGRQSDADFEDLVTVADVGISLRLPPTNGETSGALLHLLRSGIATIVTDVGTFSDYPDSVVRKVRWESEGPPGLVRAMRELSTDPGARASLGRAALEYVERNHGWSRPAGLYAEVIERCYEARTGRRGDYAPARGVPAGAVLSKGER